MSKLLDRLNQVSKGNAQPIGFKTAAAASKSSRMVLVAALKDGNTKVKEHADAALLGGTEDTGKLRKIGESLGGLPWGVSCSQATEKQIAELKNVGCDFIVCHSTSAPLALLSDDELGRVVELDPSLPDGLVRSVSQLPVDAVIIGGDTALSVQRLMVCQHISNLVAKPLMARVPSNVSKVELRELWEVGMSGAVVEVGGDMKDALAAARQAIDALPPSRRKVSGRTEASLPYIGISETDEPGIEIEEE